MSRIRFTGPAGVRISSFATLMGAVFSTYARHALRRPMAPDWDAEMEIGIRFWRRQFTRAMGQRDMARGRVIFDSLLTETDDVYPVERVPGDGPLGHWYRPETRTSRATVLYLHGGGYTFNGPISDRFARMFAYHTGAEMFAPQYRLTPEHPHPAQAEDALAAWHYLRKTVPADQIVLIGDSAGGHMVLMLLQALKARDEEQPALCFASCPWTDIGDRGASLRDNDAFDLVQGWMALQFGRWLDPEGAYGREALSPISHDYSGLAPLYLQAGGREVLRDMIVDFAHVQAKNGARVMLDLFEDMPHNFQAYDSTKASSRLALRRLKQVIDAAMGQGDPVRADPGVTVLSTL